MSSNICLDADSSAACEMDHCFSRGYPECLETGLLTMFGKNGKRALDSIMLNETFQSADLGSPADLAKFYGEYMERLQNILGDQVAKVVEIKSREISKNSLCENCPLATSDCAPRAKIVQATRH